MAGLPKDGKFYNEFENIFFSNRKIEEKYENKAIEDLIILDLYHATDPS